MKDNKGRFMKGMTPWNSGKSMSNKQKKIMEEKVYKKRIGKTYEEIYGKEKALCVKINQIKSFTPSRIENIRLSRLGKKLSEETKKKISEGNKGKIVSEKTREKIRNKLIGRKCTLETRKKISISKKGINVPEERIKRISNTMKFQYANGLRISAMLGVKLSKEQRKAISNRLKESYKNGNRVPIRMVGKNNPFYGKTHTKETMEKIRNANIGKKASEETLIKKRKYCGEKASNWQGGKSFEPYDISFNNIFKRRIRKRDNQICMLCEIHREKINRALDVHHINYDKLLSIPQNCISLCNSCHMKTNFNREHWTKFFQSILSKKYNYQYSEIGEPILNICGELKNG